MQIGPAAFRLASVIVSEFGFAQPPVVIFSTLDLRRAAFILGYLAGGKARFTFYFGAQRTLEKIAVLVMTPMISCLKFEDLNFCPKSSSIVRRSFPVLLSL